MESKTDAIIKEIAQDLLDKLKIEANCTISLKENTYLLTIETKEPALLIGYHGSTLNSFQLILATLVFRATGKREKIIVDVGDYRQKREEVLKSIAEQYARQVIETKQKITLPYFSPFERRIIHLALQNHPEVISESLGEGKERRLTIRPRDSA